MSRFFAAFQATLLRVLRDRAAMSTVIVASVIYAFYYPAAYQHQVATRLPVVAVDLDRGAMSRALTRPTAAVRDVELLGVADSLATAQALVQQGRADGILVIDAQFERAIYRGEPGHVSFLASGALLGRASTVSQGLALAVAGFAPNAALVQAGFAGAPAAAALQRVERPLFNTREGYASAVVTGVAVLIVHQTLLTGIVLLLGTHRELRGRRLVISPPELLGGLSAFLLLGALNMLFYSGFVFWFQDFPRGGNVPGLLLGVLLYAAATVCFGAFVGSFFRVREHAMQVLLMLSMPLYFLSGLSWPRTSIPEALTWAAQALPVTSGINVMVKLNQMGASLSEVRPELATLLALTLLYGGLALWRYSPRRG